MFFDILDSRMRPATASVAAGLEPGFCLTWYWEGARRRGGESRRTCTLKDSFLIGKTRPVCISLVLVGLFFLEAYMC